jgi:hypothetical protein
MNRWYIWFICFLLCGCFGKDEFIPLTDSEQIEIKDSSLGPMQIYYSLKDRKVLAKNSIYAWDLAFDCREGEFSVRMNGAKGMGVFNTGLMDFNADYSLHPCIFSIDHPNGNPNETAIGSWGDFSFKNPQGYGHVYIINRGLFEQGREIGKKKLVIKGFKDSVYYIQFSNLDGTEFYSKKILKTPGARYVHFTFEEGGQIVDIEPSMDSWDLLITPFTDTLTHLKYLFKSDDKNAVYDGILINAFSREVGIDSFRNFEEVNFRHLGDYQYTAKMNVIGKKFWYWDDVYDDYAVRETPTYILREDRELYYKFRFTGFRRNSQGYLMITFDLKNL